MVTFRANLHHPRFLRVRRHAGYVHIATPDLDVEENVVRDSPAGVKTSAVKKSHAVRTSSCILMNSAHGMAGFLRGAGGIPLRCRMLPTVWSEML